MPNKAIFLDRDNTLIDDPGYINSPEQVKLLEGVPEALAEMRNQGYKLVVITNQSAVARGIVTEEVLATIHARLEELLSEKGTHLDRIYYCPYHVDGVIAKYRKESDWRKPNPGMILKASQEMDLDISQSWCVGDRQSDIEAGYHAGCRTILIDLMSPVGRLRPEQIHPDHIAVNIREASNIVKKHRYIIPQMKGKAQQIVTPTGQPPLKEAAAGSGPAPAPRPKKVDPPPADKVDMPQSPPGDGGKLEANTRADQLLVDIHEHLTSMRREAMFDDFSIVRLFGGIAQIGVFFCLLVAVWFLLSPDRPTDPILFSLGFALVLQVMSLTFSMHGRQ